MYLNDFDDNGSLDHVICSYQDGISYPVASLDELSGQITGLKKKYAVILILEERQQRIFLAVKL